MSEVLGAWTCVPIPHRGGIDRRLEWRTASNSGRFAVVVLKKPAQALAAGDDSNLLADLRPRLQDLVIKSLVGSFAMIMK